VPPHSASELGVAPAPAGNRRLCYSLVEVPPPSAADVPASPWARAGVRLLLSAFGRLPSRARVLLATLVGRLAYLLGIRRRLTLANLAWAFPQWSVAERSAVARRTYANLAQTALDAVLAEQLPPDVLVRTVAPQDALRLKRALAPGRGMLLVTAHLGNWELLGAVAVALGLPLNAVVRPLKGAFNAEVVASRLRAGMQLIHQRNALRGTLAALRRGGAVAVVLDQSIAGKRALFVPFFGRPAATTPLVSVAALHSGAPVFLAFAPREAGALRVQIEGPIPVLSTGDRARDVWTHTASLTAAIERVIRAHPDQWLWLHRRWKVAPPPAEALRLELLALAADGERVQASAPELDAIHRRNALRLAELVEAQGWPTRARARVDGVEAAWRIVQQATAVRDFQRKCLPLLEAAVAAGEVPGAEFQAWARQLGRPDVTAGHPER
jgi:Kdo2-lipid IVA lauroyltransferase/acyltransferase